VKKLAARGGKILSPPKDMFWGDRWSLVEDADGNQWQVATHIEAVAEDEAKRRAKAAAAPPA
jgi:PhnB protein